MRLLILILIIFITQFYRSKAAGDINGLGKKLPVAPFMVLNNFGMHMCLKECEAFPLCSSINFHRKRFLCELNSVRRNESISLINDEGYVYNEISHRENRRCGTSVTCNLQSKCLRTTYDTFVCIPVFCSDPVPVIPNGYIAQSTFNPPSVTYGCNFGHIGEGSSYISCVPGQNWGIPAYSCVSVCDDNYGGVLTYGGKMYCIVPQEKSWTSAKDTCIKLNAHLMEIESAEEQSWIASIISEFGIWWIGLSDQETEGLWLWAHSLSVPQNPHWSGAGPNGGTNENCVQVSTSGWDDYPCDTTMNFICEK